LLWISQPHGRPPTFASARSWPVKMRITPGAAFAASRLIDLMRACACGDRRNAAKVWPCITTSSVYWPAPVRKRASSRRFTD
jgi:hypothetical protein